jgi:hypothetical protein
LKAQEKVMFQFFSSRNKRSRKARNTKRRLGFEQVEGRQMMAGFYDLAVLSDAVYDGPLVLSPGDPPPEAEGNITFNSSTGVLTIDGTDAHNDTVDIYINHRSGNGAGELPDLLTVKLENINSPRVRVYDPAMVKRIVFTGFGGNDRIDNHTWIPLTAFGGAGADVILGGRGNDLLMGGAQNDFIDGRAGDDTILGEAGVDALFGDDGFDGLYGGTEVDYLFGGNGGDDLRGEAGNDKLYGEAGADRLIDTSGTNTKYTDYGPTTYNVSASSFVSFDWFDRYLKDADVRSLTRLQFRDGVIDRKDMLTIYTLVATDGVRSVLPFNGSVSTNELLDLKTIISTKLNFQLDTRYFATKIANGDPANANYQGAALGNLFAGASGTHLTRLVDKWFLGGDEPALDPADGARYVQVQGSLFQNWISHTDIDQNGVSDCYFLAALGAVAKRSPSFISNMFGDNGDGTFSVRFYKGSTPVYVTVNRQLPIDNTSGMAEYADWGGTGPFNASNELWVALAEKAYAQLNESGWIGQDNTNTYHGIDFGQMSKAFAHITGRSATDHSLSSSTDLINAARAGTCVTVSTKDSGVATNIVANHAYILTGYNADTKKFLLYNPWGTTNQFSNGNLKSTTLELTWSELQANCDGWASLTI